MARVLFIENHDSFSWNVIDALPWPREQLLIRHAHEVTFEGIEHVVMGPGPTDPHRAGLVELVHETARRRLPFLGICLGHQALGLAFGARLIRSTPAHGVVDRARFIDGRTLEVMRYHSLSLAGVQPPLSVTATLDDGTVMAIAHDTLPMRGYQFHPDSFGTPEGRSLLGAASLRAPTRPPPNLTTAPAEPLELETLTDDFALLAPGFAEHGQWTLFEGLRPDARGELMFAPYGGQLRRFSGRRRLVTPRFGPASAPVVSLNTDGFEQGVEEIRQAIAAGDVYQVNLTLRAALTDATGLSLLSWLGRRHLPRFAAWVKSPHCGELVSASPELLFETRGRWIHAEPMKGTATDGVWLRASLKDRAELAMITDLLRDDLNHLCTPGTVCVTSAQRLIELPYVVQAVADVEGELSAEVTLEQCVAQLHPGGSITGAPRGAAMDHIGRLEATARGAYCGTLGLISDESSRFALLIRTAERTRSHWQYGVGAGITFASEPTRELAEVKLKLGALTAP